MNSIERPEPNWRKKQFELMCRLDDICRDNKIDLIPFADTALSAYKYRKLSDHLMACVDVKHAYTLEKELRKHKWGLGVKSMLNYHRYPYFELRAYDPNTIDFSERTAEMFDCYGLFVKIKFVHHLPDDPEERAGLNEYYWAFQDYMNMKYGAEESDEGDDAAPAEERPQMAEMREFDSPYLKRRLTKHVFETLVNAYSRESDQVSINGKIFDKGIVEDLQELSIDGRNFFVPKDLETFFRVQFGPEWIMRRPPRYRERYYCFRDGDHSWKEYQRRVSHIDLDDYKRCDAAFEAYTEEFDEYNDKILSCYDLIERTHYRFVLARKYLPKKDALQAMLDAGAYEDVLLELEDYFEALEMFREKGLGLCFDKDVFEIAMECLKHYGRDEYAEGLRALVPEVHWQPIRIKNYQGELLD